MVTRAACILHHGWPPLNKAERAQNSIGESAPAAPLAPDGYLSYRGLKRQTNDLINLFTHH